MITYRPSPTPRTFMSETNQRRIHISISEKFSSLIRIERYKVQWQIVTLKYRSKRGGRLGITASVCCRGACAKRPHFSSASKIRRLTKRLYNNPGVSRGEASTTCPLSCGKHQ